MAIGEVFAAAGVLSFHHCEHPSSSTRQQRQTAQQQQQQQQQHEEKQEEKQEEEEEKQEEKQEEEEEEEEKQEEEEEEEEEEEQEEEEEEQEEEEEAAVVVEEQEQEQEQEEGNSRRNKEGKRRSRAPLAPCNNKQQGSLPPSPSLSLPPPTFHVGCSEVVAYVVAGWRMNVKGGWVGGWVGWGRGAVRSTSPSPPIPLPSPHMCALVQLCMALLVSGTAVSDGSTADSVRFEHCLDHGIDCESLNNILMPSILQGNTWPHTHPHHTTPHHTTHTHTRK